ncbi:MAG TPA: hypothetical protein VFM88_04940 [Vicinamibacteria bacterium]|nr:hypothetical protein [Vicinamibacteria bacterium]
MAETVIGARNLMTPHGVDDYPGLLVVRPGPGWDMAVIVPKDGDTIVGRGGELSYSYDTMDGTHAGGFRLRAGDRATLVRSGLPHFLVEWRIERA